MINSPGVAKATLEGAARLQGGVRQEVTARTRALLVAEAPAWEEGARFHAAVGLQIEGAACLTTNAGLARGLWREG
jgi:hypothetical protein